MNEPHPLDNPAWWALNSHHSSFAESYGRARRYRPRTSVFAAVDRFDDEAWSDLAGLIGRSRPTSFLRDVVPAEPGQGWTERFRTKGIQMVIEEGGLLGAVEPTGARSLNVDDLEQILPLVQLTAPGPFLPGTIDLGRYYGCFEGEQLIAMAGERLHVQGYTEISAVCTRPEARGRGLASALTSRVARGILERGETPFLHLRSDNDSARRVYERLGFRRRRAVDIWVVTSPSSRPERERRP